MLLLLLASNFLSAERQTASKIVNCEKIKNVSWSYVGAVKTCYMNDATIDSDGFKISPNDETIKGLYLHNNRKIELLAEAINESFSNLLGYMARDCSIKQISYKNFKGLFQLRELYISYNQIETISSDTFKDLTSLEYLEMRENNCY
jgi:Leucine-rich repeat (LRR) protein